MAHKLGISLIAEGVEDNNQRKMLEEFECDFVQGFLFARPKPLQALIEYVKEHAT
jgi:EAL domain-containing protein (putative c-di-GMP-specific phosphodiesterase class I)